MEKAMPGRKKHSEGNRSQDGQALAEYALILTLIAVVCVAALASMGTSITGFFSGSPGWF
jgi:Flp pilus assembly pilin Flp